ncbi:GNAT family N-acetyltransferase [Streptomyces sp. DSM 110735]|uniref:GNAT family N-acetyltransferase n=1 Tax=Streptomyces sp. DSM 110735 TaxID=2775031 RepID=UPI0018F530A5|nr:GNAT family N-acetyltransferase [Streptomyces sp. DSM 110735]MBJ7905360.1 GNAT family N-acetyltransferase [Streptomyces sp. DSM 110735]
MTVLVRDLRPDVPSDPEGFVRVRRLALPYVLFTPESVRHVIARIHPDAHYRALVAEEDGEVIGTAQVSVAHESTEPGQGYVNVYVHPGRTGRGAGRLLLETGEAHLASVGATRSHSWVLDTPGNRAFAERRGYAPGHTAHFLRRDLTAGDLPALPATPPGVELRTAADFADDPRPVFALDAETASDEPSAVTMSYSDYEAWLEETWEHPLLDRELTVVCVADGRPVAFTAARTDGATRYLTAMTGTARSHRGRGLAKLAKAHSLHRARAAGVTEAFTGNDATNGPMLAVNKWLGYETCATEVQYVRELG